MWGDAFMAVCCIVCLVGMWTVRGYSKKVREVGIQWADEDQLFRGLVMTGIGITGLLWMVVSAW